LSTTPVLTVDGLWIRSRKLPTSSAALVQGLCFSVHQERPFLLIGETGSGKSLLAQTIAATLPGDLVASGSILFEGREVLSGDPNRFRWLWGSRVLLIPQEPRQALNPLMRVKKQVMEILHFVRGMANGTAKLEVERVFDTLLLPEETGDTFPGQLSGGMAQRVLFAMALVSPARLVVLDEPTKGLDSDLRDKTADLIRTLVDQGKTILCITHDIALARDLGGDVAVMHGGKILEQGQTENVLSAPGHPYTQGLLRSLPENGLHPIAPEILAGLGEER
jgi:peptide/nickel transport system ATP-binding protein